MYYVRQEVGRLIIVGLGRTARVEIVMLKLVAAVLK